MGLLTWVEACYFNNYWTLVIFLSENFIDSNEDINKLLAPHENDNVEDDVLSTGNAHTDNLLKEITSEEHSYKSAELFSVNPSELENEFQERNTLNEDVISGEKTEDVQAMFEKDAVNQVEVDDQFGDEAFKPASEGNNFEAVRIGKCFYPLLSNISIDILHTFLFTFSELLTRTCLTTKSLFSWWSFPLCLLPSWFKAAIVRRN